MKCLIHFAVTFVALVISASHARTFKSQPVGIKVNSISTDKVAIIVAQGYMGRTTISCDDGQSWIADRSYDKEGNDMVCGSTTPVVCQVSSCKVKQSNGTCSTQTPCDCVHGSGPGKGVAIANNQILANFGWGGPGMILRSTDGLKWTNSSAFDGSMLYPNLVFTENLFFHFSSQSRYSSDGLNWSNSGFANFNGQGQSWTSPRAFAALNFNSGTRLIAGIDGNTMRISSDMGKTWFIPQSIPAGCTDGMGNTQKILTGNNIALYVTDSGKSCRTTDGGNTWTLHNINNGGLNIFPVFANGKFMAWSSKSGMRYSSIDGATWTSTAMKGNTDLGPIGVSASGTLVSINGWDSGYNSQQFLRSTDEGLSWIPLAVNQYTKSHAIVRFESGYISRGGVCP